MKKIIEKYFEYFSNKDIQMLKSLFSMKVSLKDWEINANGFDEVVQANIKIFNNVETIQVSLVEYYEHKKSCVCLIDILVNKKETINVIDVIRFDENNKILEISAYKQ